MGLGDLFENIRDGFETAKDKLVDIKDDMAYIVEDFADEPKDGLYKILDGVKEVVGAGGTPFKNPALVIAGDIGNPLKGPVSEIVGSFLTKKVTPKPGCIMICKIAGGLAEHSGVYIGDDTVVELNGSGDIQEVSLAEFLNDGITRTGVNIYVACDSSNKVLCDKSIAKRAEDIVGDVRDYNLIMDNCHQFTAGCITGDFENADNFFVLLAHSIKNEMNNGEQIRWLVCNR